MIFFSNFSFKASDRTNLLNTFPKKSNKWDWKSDKFEQNWYFGKPFFRQKFIFEVNFQGELLFWKAAFRGWPSKIKTEREKFLLISVIVSFNHKEGKITRKFFTFKISRIKNGERDFLPKWIFCWCQRLFCFRKVEAEVSYFHLQPKSREKILSYFLLFFRKISTKKKIPKNLFSTIIPSKWIFFHGSSLNEKKSKLIFSLCTALIFVLKNYFFSPRIMSFLKTSKILFCYSQHQCKLFKSPFSH